MVAGSVGTVDRLVDIDSLGSVEGEPELVEKIAKGAPESCRSESYLLCPTPNTSPAKRLAKDSASSSLAKQNTTKSLSSRRREYVSCAAGSSAAAVNITSLFLRPAPFRTEAPHDVATFAEGRHGWFHLCGGS
jgi:hypothetical protein